MGPLVSLKSKLGNKFVLIMHFSFAKIELKIIKGFTKLYKGNYGHILFWVSTYFPHFLCSFDMTIRYKSHMVKISNNCLIQPNLSYELCTLWPNKLFIFTQCITKTFKFDFHILIKCICLCRKSYKQVYWR